MLIRHMHLHQSPKPRKSWCQNPQLADLKYRLQQAWQASQTLAQRPGTQQRTKANWQAVIADHDPAVMIIAAGHDPSAVYCTRSGNPYSAHKWLNQLSFELVVLIGAIVT